MAEGGIAKAWTASGQSHFEIREIDYAEVLRERQGADGAAWNRIIEFCLQGNANSGIDERTLEAVIGALDNPDRFNELLQAVQSSSGSGAHPSSARGGTAGIDSESDRGLERTRSTRPGGDRADRRRFGRAHDARNDALVPARGPRHTGDR